MKPARAEFPEPAAVDAMPRTRLRCGPIEPSHRQISNRRHFVRKLPVTATASSPQHRARPAGRWLTVAALLFALLPCFAQSPAATRKLKIVGSFLPAYCVAANVAGDAAFVENLLPGAVNPHEFQLAPKDLKRIEEADLIVLNGLALEEWFSKLANRFPANGKPKIFRCADGLEDVLIPIAASGGSEASKHADHDHADHTGHAHGGKYNPHLWLDPMVMARVATNLSLALSALDPANTERYRGNARAYAERLKELDQRIERTLTPVRSKPFVTLHDAFPYFSRRYQLRLSGVLELEPEVSPSPRYLGQLVRRMRQDQVSALFTEPGNTPRIAKQVAADLGIATVELETLETGKPEASAYESGLVRIAETLEKHLSKPAPTR